MSLLAGLNIEQLNDQTIIQAGGGRDLLPAGRALVRPFLYIECGMHVETYKGKAKPAAPYFRFGVKIVGGVGKNLEGKVEKYVLEEGKYPQLVPFFKQQLSFTEKAKTPKWLAALNKVGETKTHMALKVADSELYYLDIGVETKDDGKTYNTYDFALLQPAIKFNEDEETGEVTEVVVKAPKLDESDMKILIWDLATKEQWDSIYIDGTYDKKDKDGKVIETVSKNRYQEECMTATNWEGSVLQGIAGGIKMPDLDAEKPSSVPSVPETTDVPAVPVIPE